MKIFTDLDVEKWFIAAKKGDSNELIKFLQLGFSVDTLGPCGLNALMHAAFYGQIECLKLLIDHGADVNLIAEDKESAAIFAVRPGKLEALKLLIEAGIDLNLQDKDGTTAVMWAVQFSHKEILETLIKAGANLYIENNFGTTAFDMARNGNSDCIGMIQSTIEKTEFNQMIVSNECASIKKGFKL